MKGVEAQTDDELLAERRPGHAGRAYAAFYVRHERAVLAYFRRRVPSSELAADLTAETFAEALVSRARYRPQQGGSAVAWLFGVAGNVLSRSLRRGVVERRARAQIGMPDRVVDDAQLAAIDELTSESAVLAALENLPVEQRDVVRARVLEDRAYPDIATDLQISETTARKRVSRGLATLRRNLEESR